MSLILFIVLKTVPLSRDIKIMVKLIFIGGLSTFIMGVLFGGWFGMKPEEAPNFMVHEVGDKLMFYGQIFDPLNDLLTKVAPLAFGLGMSQVILGVVLKGVIKVKNNKTKEAFFEDFLFALFLIISTLGAIPIVLNKFNILAISENVQNVIIWIMLISTIFAILGQAYNSSKLMKILVLPALLISVFSFLNNLIGLIPKVFSYARLFALGLATGMIGWAFNLIASIFKELIMGDGTNIILVIIGILFATFIIICGHLVNITLNLLGAYIHSGRLQFVEFFGLFLECGGKKFQPLKQESKYVFREEK